MPNLSADGFTFSGSRSRLTQWNDDAQQCYEPTIPGKKIAVDLAIDYCTRP
jgi:hypothetical protein